MSLIKLLNINEAIKHLKAGDLVIYPTETAYALGADAINASAIKKIFAVKKRQRHKALPLIISSVAMANHYCKVNKTEKTLIKKYWPGALTVVMNAKKELLPKNVLGLKRTVAMRVSAHKLARELARRLGRPIAATSANISGQDNCYSERALYHQFRYTKTPIYFLSDGTLPKRKPSTIVQIIKGKIKILRQGEIML